MYAKVFRSMWEGTLAGTGETWAVFVFLLAHCDREGFVDIHPRVISSLTGFSQERVVKALGELESADFSSRTEDQQGARIERIDAHRDWGWRIVNLLKYRNLVDAETVRAQTRERVRKHRESKRPVTTGNAEKRHADVDTEAATRIKVSRSLRSLDPEGFAEFFEAYPVKVGRKPCAAKWESLRLGEHLSEILAGVAKWKISERWQEPKFICDPLVFLNQERWKDVPEQARANGALSDPDSIWNKRL